MISLDFSKIDLIIENACLKLDVVKAELTQRERIIIKREPRRYLNNVGFELDSGRQRRVQALWQGNDFAQSLIAQGRMGLSGGFGLSGLGLGIFNTQG